MKIYQCCPYYNESLIAEINIKEASKWIDEFHITEGNLNFQGQERNYIFNSGKEYDIVKYHKIDCKNKYKRNNLYGKISLWKNRFSSNDYIRNILTAPTWYNEAVQRNESCSKIIPEDDDIVILSDIDEIIDSKYADKIIEEVKKRDIITIKLHFTLFYFNLFSDNWGGPKDYSYRVFIMTGKYFKNMSMSSDELRKLGEQGKLYNDIYCIDEICGFHHSWLGDENFIFNKIKSYAHTEHSEYADIDYIKECLKNKKSIFPGHNLSIRNDINLIDTIEKNKNNIFKEYFI